MYLDILHSSEGSEELPENVLLSLGSEIVDKDAPTRPVGGHAGQQGVARQQVAGKGRKPEDRPGQSGCLAGEDRGTNLS